MGPTEAPGTISVSRSRLIFVVGSCPARTEIQNRRIERPTATCVARTTVYASDHTSCNVIVTVGAAPRSRKCKPPDKRGGLNGSTQHFLGVYSQESENLKFLVGVDLGAALLCSDPTGNSRLGLRSSGSIVVRVRLYFRSSRVARDSADHRSRLAHRWPA